MPIDSHRDDTEGISTTVVDPVDNNQQYCLYSSYQATILLVVGVLLTGVIYILAQWFRTTAIKDAVFVSMLLGATMILMRGIRSLDSYIRDKGLDFYAFTMPPEDPKKGYREYDKLRKRVFSFGGMTVSGLIYGSAVGSAPIILDVWTQDVVLKWLLALFMFAVNFVTGIAFFGLIVFFVCSISMGKIAKVELWQRENPSTAFLLGASRRIAFLASIYISICISSILFSELPVSELVIAYSVFSVLIILASLLIPTFHIAEKLISAKRGALLEVSNQLQAEFQRLLENSNTSQNNEGLKKLESLLFLREKIEAVQIWPFKLKLLGSAISVICVSSIPVVLQFALEHL